MTSARRITRREVLVAGAAGSLCAAGTPKPAPAQNLSYPLSSIEGTLTPRDRFFVRDHFHEPIIPIRSWRLKVEGRVNRELELGLADLIEAPGTSLECVLECAGNVAGGSAASNGKWGGVPFKTVLEQAGAKPDATMVLLQGEDHGSLGDGLADVHYTQVVPITKCLQASSMIAFKLNDELLPRRNGFPARALFPGWYAMDSVKWLRRIAVLGANDPTLPFDSSGMTKLYNRVMRHGDDKVTARRLTAMQVKSAIAWPGDKARLPAGMHIVNGFAWTGEGRIRSVSVSTDGGTTWASAELDSPPKPLTWVRWKYQWNAREGEHVLMSRGVDDSGAEQPLTRDPERRDFYEMNFCERIRCSVL